MIQTLTGIKVVDLTVAGSGPACTRLLAEYGAEVVMIEPLAGVNTRTFWEMDYYDTRKKSLPVDLKTDAGKKIVYALIKDADVFVTNYRIKAMTRLGFDYHSLRKIKPDIIYATLTGYGLDGPDKDSPGYDPVSYWAKAGLLNALGDKNGVIPVPLTGYGDPISGKTLALGVCAAIYHKEMTGEGMEVTTSLLADGVYQNHTTIIETQYGSEWPKSRTAPDSALENTYPCADGWVYISTDQFIHLAGIFKAVGLRDLAGDPMWQGMQDVRGEKGAKLTAILDAVFLTCQVDDVVEALAQHSVPCYKILSIPESMQHPQVLANKYYMPNTDITGRKTRVQSSPVRFGNNEPLAYKTACQLGEHTEEILRGLHYSDEKIRELIAQSIVVAQQTGQTAEKENQNG